MKSLGHASFPPTALDRLYNKEAISGVNVLPVRDCFWGGGDSEKGGCLFTIQCFKTFRSRKRLSEYANGDIELFHRSGAQKCLNPDINDPDV
ncbi:hypothetical protein TNCV_2421941 [Trichonephila clavipes]|nr:hypothetical protein TNCV_2421941 [Trichonephila clavipes]